MKLKPCRKHTTARAVAQRNHPGNLLTRYRAPSIALLSEAKDPCDGWAWLATLARAYFVAFALVRSFAPERCFSSTGIAASA